jgi:ornithine cyclodeaminase/alanine dehydrogenase-like protein (mu-crystallin family)
MVLSAAADVVARVSARTRFDLSRGKVPGRRAADEITLFKSEGTAIEDLATAIMVYQKAA